MVGSRFALIVSTAAAGLLTAAVLDLIPQPGPLAAAPGMSDLEAIHATQQWLADCAALDGATIRGCPQRARDIGQPAAIEFAWSPEAPLIEWSRANWSSAEGLYDVRVAYHLRYRHTRSGSNTTFTGDYHGYAEIGLRPMRDARDFGALTLRATAFRTSEYRYIYFTYGVATCCLNPEPR